MFKIIGGDGRQYGPITAEQLRDWIAQGRANGQTLVQPEGSAEWKPLASLPEFAAAVSAAAVPPVLQTVDPRKSKLIAGLLGVLLGSLGVHRFYLGYTGIGLAQLLLTVVSCGVLWLPTFIWGLIEGVLILCGSTITTDADGRALKDQ